MNPITPNTGSSLQHLAHTRSVSPSESMTYFVQLVQHVTSFRGVRIPLTADEVTAAERSNGIHGGFTFIQVRELLNSHATSKVTQSLALCVKYRRTTLAEMHTNCINRYWSII